LIAAALIASACGRALIARDWEDTMKVTQLATALACLLALAGCPNSQLPLADSELDSGDGTSSADSGRAADGTAGGAATGSDGGTVDGPVRGHASADGGTVNGSVQGHPGPDAGTANAPVRGHASADSGTVEGHPGPDAGTVNDAVPGNASHDAGSVAPPTQQLQTLSLGCQRIADTDLCFGEGWMLADGESIPGCNESGAYRVCTFANGACVSHTVMMVQRCD
jgi:hypothetical protein